MTATKGCPEGGTKWAFHAFMKVLGARGGFRVQLELFQPMRPIPDGSTVPVSIPRSGADGAAGADGANGAEVTSFFCIYSVRDMLDTFPNNQNSHTRRQSPRLGWGRS